jgi:hypothetical protein
MPGHDPTGAERTAIAWQRFRRLMAWMVVAAVAAVLIALIFLKSSGGPMRLHMVIATIAGVGFSVLLGTALMGLVYFSNNSGHDEAATTRRSDDERE